MASLLRQIVAGPRAQHPEAGLDLCYVTDHIIATSGPSQTYPQLAYRNPLDDLVKFLDSKHGEEWAIWEFRAEGTGYTDDAVYNRIRHYPFPDHHPPPFRLMPLILASMRNWLHGGDLVGGTVIPDGQPALTAQAKSDKKRVAVVHCKAGKGRSGTISCSYLIAEEGWTPEDALARFTERRMRPKFGAGVSIPSQLRWVRYIDRWTRGGKKYMDRPIEITEIHVWGLRSGVKVEVEGFEDEGKRIASLHTFAKDERHIVDPSLPEESSIGDLIWEMAGYSVNRGKEKAPEEADYADDTNPDETTNSMTTEEKAHIKGKAKSIKKRGTQLLHKAAGSTSRLNGDDKAKPPVPGSSASSSKSNLTNADSDQEAGGMAVILRPAKPIRLPNSDVNISVERRNRTNKSMGLTLVTAVAHVWFNAFFEGDGPEQDGKPSESGVFGIEWEAMDGIKGSSRKGSRAMDRIAVVWRYADADPDAALAAEGKAKDESVIIEPADGQPVPQTKAADWKGKSPEGLGPERELGLRKQSPASADISRASSIRGAEGTMTAREEDDNDLEGVKSSGPEGEELRLDDKEGGNDAKKSGADKKDLA